MTKALYYGDNLAILRCIGRMRRPLKTMNDAKKLELGAIGNRSNGAYFDLDVL